MPVSYGKGRTGRITDVMRVRSAQHAGGIARRSADVAVEGKRSGRKKRFLQGESRSYIACAAKATGFSAGHKRNAGFQRIVTAAALGPAVRDYHHGRAITAVFVFF